jgi:hypothetical protein
LYTQGYLGGQFIDQADGIPEVNVHDGLLRRVVILLFFFPVFSAGHLNCDETAQADDNGEYRDDYFHLRAPC